MESILILQREVRTHTRPHGHHSLAAVAAAASSPVEETAGRNRCASSPSSLPTYPFALQNHSCFSALILIKKTMSCQDRLGTNVREQQSRLVLVVVSLTHRSSATVSVIPSQTSQGWQSRCLLRSNASCVSNRCEKEHILQRDRGQCLYTIDKSTQTDSGQTSGN